MTFMPTWKPHTPATRFTDVQNLVDTFRNFHNLSTLKIEMPERCRQKFQTAITYASPAVFPSLHQLDINTKEVYILGQSPKLQSLWLKLEETVSIIQGPKNYFGFYPGFWCCELLRRKSNAILKARKKPHAQGAAIKSLVLGEATVWCYCANLSGEKSSKASRNSLSNQVQNSRLFSQKWNISR